MPRQRVKRESLTEQVKNILIDRIVDGVLTPGDRLKELQIASEFGTSQAPVREAIRSLQALGYVEHRPHVGALVKTHDRREIEEAFQVREALEGYCLLMAAIDVDRLAEQLQLQLAAMKAAARSGNVKAFTKADNRFHRAIVTAPGNQSMLGIWDSLRMQLQVMITIMETSMPLTTLHDLHPQLVKALAAGNRQEAACLLTEHYRTIGKFWQEARGE